MIYVHCLNETGVFEMAHTLELKFMRTSVP